MMLVPRPDGHAHHAPVAEDVLVGIEVSDTSLRTDLRIKVPLCARTGQTLRVCPPGPAASVPAKRYFVPQGLITAFSFM